MALCAIAILDAVCSVRLPEEEAVTVVGVPGLVGSHIV